MRVEGSDHQRLPWMDRWLFQTVKFDPVAMDCPSVCGKLGFDQNTFKIRSGFKLVRLKNNGATPVGIIANFSHCGVKARHKECLRWLGTFRGRCVEVNRTWRLGRMYRFDSSRAVSGRRIRGKIDLMNPA
jgi:hypothetical protein